jgi:NDP-sugar pyrophosphorylase family protein
VLDGGYNCRMELIPTSFFDLSDPASASIFKSADRPWSPLLRLGEIVRDLIRDSSTTNRQLHPGVYLGNGPFFIADSAVIEPGAYIVGPAYIGPNSVVRHGAYVRENVVLLAGSLVGHASEAKNSIFLPGAHAPHFNYVGDSILGSDVNLGAGTKLSNLAINSAKDPTTGIRPTIQLVYGAETYDTGLAKLGAILGDGVQTGCNSVLNPGCVVGPRTLIYPNLSLRKGVHPADSVIKLRQRTSVIPRR